MHLISALLLILSLATYTTSLADCLTLEICLDLALQNRSDLKAARHIILSEQHKLTAARKGLGFRTDLALSVKHDNRSRDLGESTLRESISRYQNEEFLRIQQTFPWGTSFDLYLNYMLNSEDHDLFDTLEANSLNYGASVRQELFVPSFQLLDIEAAEARMYESIASYDVLRRNIIFSVSQVFYNLLRVYQVQEIREKSLHIAKSLSDLAKRQYEKGISIDVGLLEAMVSHSLAEANMQQAAMDIDAGRNNLLRSMECTPSNVQLCSIKQNDQRDLPDKMDLLGRVERHPSLEVINHQVKQLKTERRREKRSFQRLVALEAAYDKEIYGHGINDWHRQQQHDQTWFAGIRLEFPLWDNGVNRDKTTAIAQQIQSLIKTNRTNYENLRTDLQNTFDAIQRLDDIINRLVDARRFADRNMALMRAKFAKGLNNVDDVIRTEQSLTNIRLSMISAVIDYEINIVKLYELTGHRQLSPI
jgi:outer membrane protein